MYVVNVFVVYAYDNYDVEYNLFELIWFIKLVIIKSIDYLSFNWS